MRGISVEQTFNGFFHCGNINWLLVYLLLWDKFDKTSQCCLYIRPWEMRLYLGLVQFTGGGVRMRGILVGQFFNTFLWWEHQLLVAISLPVGQIGQNQSMLLGHKAMGEVPKPQFGPICGGGGVRLRGISVQQSTKFFIGKLLYSLLFTSPPLLVRPNLNLLF
jgi:hypothetical protein